MFNLKSIRPQLLGLVAAAVVPFLFLIGFGLWQQSRNLQAEALQRALTEARLGAGRLDDHFGNLENLMTGLSVAVSARPTDAEANDEVLRRLKPGLPAFIADVRVVSPNGDVIGSAAGYRFNMGHEDYIGRALAGERFAVGDPLFGHQTSRWIFPAARPLSNANGEIAAVLVIGTVIESFEQVLRMEELPPGSVVRIINDKKVAIASYPSADGWVGRKLNDPHLLVHLGQGEGSEVAVWKGDGTRIVGFAMTHLAPWQIFVALPPNIAPVSAALPWFLHAILPAEIASSPVTARLMVGGLFSFVAIVVASLIAWALSGRIIQPLRRLERDAEILAQGDLGHRTAISAPEELRKLSGAFNFMAASLERQRDVVMQNADDVRRAKDTLDAVIDASPLAIVCSDRERKIILWNRGAERIYGWTPAEAMGRTIRIVPPEGRDVSRELHQRALRGETIRGVEVKRVRKDGIVLDIGLSAAPLFSSAGTVRGVAYAHEDITARKCSEQQLRNFADFDQLTGLANRRTFEEALARHLGAEPQAPTAVGLLDLDGFKDVNDTLGHSIGDRLLIEVARRLREVALTCDPSALVCRLGGDEFVVVLPGCGDPLVLGEFFAEMLRRLEATFEISENVLHLGASAGLAIASAHGATVDGILSNADLALYEAKRSGGRIYRFFAPTMRAHLQARRALDAEMRKAVENSEFELHYQPQIRLKDGAIVGAEALLRWRHCERGILAPGLFIEALSQNVIAPEVGRWIMHTGCMQAARWRAEGFTLGRIGINLFPAHLRFPGLIEDVERTLRASGLPAELLELEIT